MMVGDILALAASDSAAFADWLAREDAALARRCREAAGDRPLDRWLLATVAWFELHANGDDWADLTSRVRGSETPGRALLGAMVERRLRGCGHGEGEAA